MKKDLDFITVNKTRHRVMVFTIEEIDLKYSKQKLIKHIENFLNIKNIVSIEIKPQDNKIKVMESLRW